MNRNEIIKQFNPLWAIDVAGNATKSNYFDTIRNSNAIARVFYMYFTNLVSNMFKWKNIPESMDETYIEDMLMFEGKCACVNDANNGLMNPQYTATKVDWYGRPVEIDTFANDYQASFGIDNFVIIRNTNNYIPTFLYIDYFVQKIINVDDIIAINLNAQKTPVVFSGTREQRELLKAEFEKYDGNSWYLFLEEQALGHIASVNTNAPYLADKLTDLMKYYFDLFLTFIGLNNANGTFKRERSLVDEITANNELIGLTCDSMLTARKKAVEQINDKFSKELNGNKIEVEYSEWVEKMREDSDNESEFNLEEADSEEGGESDE